jgi:hypothetical protein
MKATLLILLLVFAVLPQTRQQGGVRLQGSVKRAVSAGGGGSSASDDFNRSDGNTLGANWVSIIAFGCSILSNQAVGDGGNCWARWAGAGSFTDDQYSQITVATHVAAASNNAGVRLSGTTFGTMKGYFCGATRDTGPTDDRYKIWVINADSTPTQVAAVTGGTPLVTTGDVIKLSVTFSGGVNTLTCTRNGSALTGLTGITDSTLGTGGMPGFGASASTNAVDDWSAGAP